MLHVPGVAVAGGVTSVGVKLAAVQMSKLLGMLKLVLGMHALTTGVQVPVPVARVAAVQLPVQPSPDTKNEILPKLERAVTGSVS